LRPGLVESQFEDPEHLIRRVQWLLNHMNALYDRIDPINPPDSLQQDLFRDT
jgi:hypothetical protein